MQTEQDDNASVDDKPKARTGKPLGLRRPQNNNHHVVPLGILVVLATIYLMIAGLQINYTYYFRTGVDAVEISQKDDDSHENTIPLPSEIDVAQHQPLCRKVEIFTRKVMNGLSDISKNKPKSNKTGLALGSGIRQSKSGKNDKKKDTSKKPNTAEPIIYLFALVFIYLLLKAASDINQHYKTVKNKNRISFMKTIKLFKISYSRTREINDYVVVPYNPMHKRTKEALIRTEGHLKVFQQKVCQNFKRILNYINVTECFLNIGNKSKLRYTKYYIQSFIVICVVN